MLFARPLRACRRSSAIRVRIQLSLALNPSGLDGLLEAGIKEGLPPPADGSSLTAAITQEEVISALHVLIKYKASGISRCPTELLKYALVLAYEDDEPLPEEVDVACHLTHLLNLVFSSGEVLADMNTVLVSPIFKKGDRSDTADYQPISVSDCFEELYAAVLNARLVTWLEAHDLKAACQSGFRPNVSTEHRLFALQHFVEDSRRKGLPLYMRVSWILLKHMTLCRGHCACCGASCKRLVCLHAFWVRCSLCTKMSPAG